MKTTKTIALVVLVGAVALCGNVGAQSLAGFPSFPADTFASGPTSGQFIATTNGRVPGQPDPNEFIILRLDHPLPLDEGGEHGRGNGHGGDREEHGGNHGDR